jgi:hypothetical protein
VQQQERPGAIPAFFFGTIGTAQPKLEAAMRGDEEE